MCDVDHLLSGDVVLGVNDWHQQTGARRPSRHSLACWDVRQHAWFFSSPYFSVINWFILISFYFSYSFLTFFSSYFSFSLTAMYFSVILLFEFQLQLSELTLLPSDRLVDKHTMIAHLPLHLDICIYNAGSLLGTCHLSTGHSLPSYHRISTAAIRPLTLATHTTPL